MPTGLVSLHLHELCKESRKQIFKDIPQRFDGLDRGSSLSTVCHFHYIHYSIYSLYSLCHFHYIPLYAFLFNCFRNSSSGQLSRDMLICKQQWPTYAHTWIHCRTSSTRFVTLAWVCIQYKVDPVVSNSKGQHTIFLGSRGSR